MIERSARAHGLLIVAIVSYGLAAGIGITGDIFWHGDSHVYVNFAYDLAQNAWNPSLQALRAPGYSTLLIAVGVLSGSLLGLVILQTLMAGTIPLLVYGTISWASPRVALAVALVLSLSLIPYNDQLVVYHSLMCTFTLIAAAFLMVRWWLPEGKPWLLYLLSLALIFAAWGRTTAYILAAVCLIAALVRGKHLAHVLLAASLFVAVTGGFSAWRQSHVPVLPRSTYALGPQLLYAVYLNGLLVPDATLEAKLGDNFKEIMARPTVDNYLKIVAGEADNDAILTLVVRSMLQHPFGTAGYIAADLWGFTLGLPWLFTGQYDPPTFFPFIGETDPRTQIMNLKFEPRWTTRSPPTARQQLVSQAYQKFYGMVARTAAGLLLLGCLGFSLLPKRLRFAPFLVGALYLAYLGPLAVLVEPQYRYCAEAVPIAAAGAGFGIIIVLAAARGGLRA
jgi:hypothetical protein